MFQFDKDEFSRRSKVEAKQEQAPDLYLELCESKRRLATLVDNLPGIAYRCEANSPWRMTYISEGVEDLTGYTVAEMLSGEVSWAFIMHPDDIAEVETEVAEALTANRQFSIKYRIVTRAGEQRWLHEKARRHGMSRGAFSLKAS